MTLKIGQGHQNIVNYLDCPKGRALLAWLEQGSRDTSILVKF